MSARPRRRWLRWSAAILAVLAIAAFVLHAQLPRLLLARYHAIGAGMGHVYVGTASAADTFLAQGRYRLHDARVVRRDGRIETPLVTARVIDVQMIPWRRESTVRMHDVRVHLVGGPGEPMQLGEGVPWRRLLEELAPGSPVQRVEISALAVSFRQARQPELVVTLDNLSLSLDGLDGDTAVLDLDGLLMAHAPIKAHAEFDPRGPIDALRLRARAHEVELPKLNDFARAWSRIDFHEGDGEFALALDYAPPRVRGALGAILSNVDVFDLRQDVGDGGVAAAVREFFAGAKVTLMKTEADRRIAREFAIDAKVDPLTEDNFEGLRAVLHAAFADLGRHLPE